MPRSRLTSTETAAITARLLAGESVAAVARSMGRSRQALSRIKGSLDRKEVLRLSVKLNIRITEGEHAAFQAVAEWLGITGSGPAPQRPQRPPAPPQAVSPGRTAEYARELWVQANRETVPGHPYAIAKRIWWPAGAGRVRASGKIIGRDADCIVVPIRDPDGDLVAVEVLSEHRDPAGKFLRQSFGPKRNGWLTLGNDLDTAIPRYVCEGWATGAKMLEFLGNCCVYVAFGACLLYTSPSPRDGLLSRMPSSA